MIFNSFALKNVLFVQVFLCFFSIKAEREAAVQGATRDIESFSSSLEKLMVYQPGDKINAVDELTCFCLAESIEDLTKQVGASNFDGPDGPETLINSRKALERVCRVLEQKFLSECQASPSKITMQQSTLGFVIGKDFSCSQRLHCFYHNQPEVVILAQALEKFFTSIHWAPFFKQKFSKVALLALRKGMLEAEGFV